jgi:site-specific DNA recombinase
MKKRGVELKLIIGTERSRAAGVEQVLLKTIARAHRWLDWLVSGEVKSLNEIAAREDVTRSFVGRIIRLAFLVPEIVEAIVEGKQPPELTAELLTKRLQLSLDWDDQKRLIAGKITEATRAINAPRTSASIAVWRTFMRSLFLESWMR